MDAQVVRSPIGAPDTFSPSHRVLNLCIPAVSRVVCHLVSHVLAEPQPPRVDTNIDQELGYTCDKVAQCFVCDDAFIDGLAYGKGYEVGFTCGLRIARQDANLDIADLREFFVGFIEGIYKVFDFGHCELAHAEEARAWGDFVAEGAADLRGCEWDAVVVEFEEAGEIEEVALGSFGA